eukprot:jgi/Tetstr1/427206/TSEL_017394.t1
MSGRGEPDRGAAAIAGTAASPKLNGMVGVLRQHQKKPGGIIKHNTNAVKNLAATQAFTGDNYLTSTRAAIARIPRPRRPSSPPSQRMECRPIQGRGDAGARARGGAGARAAGGPLGTRGSR